MSGQEPYPTKPLLEPLTRRERDILILLAQGLSGPEIAEKLTLAVSSVRWHTKHVYAKLGVNSKKQAVARAHELGLLSAPPVAAASEPRSAAMRPGVPVSGASQTAPFLAARPEQRHNLPLQVTRFFGREGEVAQLIERLSENRLVTLSGSGGVGKTRLSLRTAEEVLDDFTDGVWIVELAPLSDPALVAQQVASSLGLRDDPGRPVLETLASYMRDRQLLLVLDNCEHLLDACGRLANRLLRACPGLRILASSRQPLGIAGEAVLSVPSLSFPDPDHLPPIDRFHEYMAMSLLIDRARLVLPDYQVTARNAASLARICQRLDGIPLAIEMAAARLNILNADQLAARLDDAFRLLTGGSRSALPRQQTLRATLDWSYNLLSEQERLLFQRLSVFAGGCTLEAAEAVCSDERLESLHVLERLGSLVAKSVVVADRQPGEEPRYLLLEITRQYAREKLQDSGDSVLPRARHLDYFLKFAETNVPKKIQSRERLILTRKLATERENLRRALEWSFSDLVDVEAGPRLVNALGLFCPWLSAQEQLNWLVKAVALCQSHTEISDHVYASLLGHASDHLAVDDPQTALAGLRHAVDVSRGLGPKGRRILMWNLYLLGDQYLQQRTDATPAVAPLVEAEAILLELGPDGILPDSYLWVMALFAGEEAYLANSQGQYEDAKTRAREGVRLFEESGDRWSGIQPLIHLGTACLNLAEYGQARVAFLLAMALIEECGEWNKAYVLRWLGMVDLQTGHLDRALGYCRESLQVAEGMPDHNAVASGLGVCACIAAKQGQPIRSARLSGAAQAMYAKQQRNAWEDSSLDTLLPGWRDEPDAGAISAVFEAGLAMNADQAMAYALDDAAD